MPKSTPVKKSSSALKVAKASFAHEGPVYSPFSGQPADGDDGPNEIDATLLLIEYGMGGDYAYASPRLIGGGDVDALAGKSATALVKKASITNAVIFEVDTGRNGVNTYVFAPVTRGS